jgi:uncharacterized membrane protein YhaH (DUF805 family)
MRGEILDFDDAKGTGLISGDDGLRYRFDRASLATPATVTRGLRVDFSPLGEEATQIMLLEAPAAASPWAQTSAPASTGYAAAAPAAPSTSIDWAKLFFSFNGRIRRTHYWIGWAILFVGGFILGLIPLLNILGILLIWPNLAVGVKRLHDMGKTGWLIAIPYVIQIAAVIFTVANIGFAALANPDGLEDLPPEEALALIGPSMGAILLAMVVSIGFWIWMGVGDSQRGDNKYGLNPKGEN